MYLQGRMPWPLPDTPFGLELKNELPNGGVPQNKELGGGPALRAMKQPGLGVGVL